MQTHAPHVRHVRETLLSDNWYTLKKYTFELLRRDGRWQEQSREAYDRGNGAVIFTLQPGKADGGPDPSVPFSGIYLMATTDISLRRPPGCWITPSPEARIVAEAEEETGFRVTRVEPVFTVFMSPGSVTEKLYFLSPNIRPMTVGATAADWRRKVRILKYWSCR